MTCGRFFAPWTETERKRGRSRRGASCIATARDVAEVQGDRTSDELCPRRVRETYGRGCEMQGRGTVRFGRMEDDIRWLRPDRRSAAGTADA